MALANFRFFVFAKDIKNMLKASAEFEIDFIFNSPDFVQKKVCKTVQINILMDIGKNFQKNLKVIEQLRNLNLDFLTPDSIFHILFL